MSFSNGHDNLLIRVKDHANEMGQERALETITATVEISPSLLEQAHATQAGLLLLRLLSDVDYAGRQGRPVMLKGRAAGALKGFRLQVVVPVRKGEKRGPPPPLWGNGSPRIG